MNNEITIPMQKFLDMQKEIERLKEEIKKLRGNE